MILKDVLFHKGPSALPMKEVDRREPLAEMILRLVHRQPQIVSIEDIRILLKPLTRQRIGPQLPDRLRAVDRRLSRSHLLKFSADVAERRR